MTEYRQCGCASTNADNQGAPNVVLDPRPIFEHTTRTVSVDACTAPLIEKLWAEGIWTKGVCCGHGRVPPSIGLSDPYDFGKASEVIEAARPGEQWQMFGWIGLSEADRKTGFE